MSLIILKRCFSSNSNTQFHSYTSLEFSSCAKLQAAGFHGFGVMEERNTLTLIHTHKHTHKHTHTQTHTHNDTHTHSHIHTLTMIHTRTHTHTRPSCFGILKSWKVTSGGRSTIPLSEKHLLYNLYSNIKYKKYKNTLFKIINNFVFSSLDLVLMNCCGVDVVQVSWAEWPHLCLGSLRRPPSSWQHGSGPL